MFVPPVRAILTGFFLVTCTLHSAKNVYATQFYTEIMDLGSVSDIDVSRFSDENYILPGTYFLNINVNEKNILQTEVVFIEVEKHDGKTVLPCLEWSLIEKLGLTPSALNDVVRFNHNQCTDITAVGGVSVQVDLSESILLIRIPQSKIEYQNNTWLPPSRWDHGVDGFIIDYDFTTSYTQSKKAPDIVNSSIYGTLGVNHASWRVRADYQSTHVRERKESYTRFDWSRLYAYRPIPDISSTVTIGEAYLTSDLFNTMRFAGASLNSDERMLPPQLRGYAPEVTGIAGGNAKVIISQKGRVLYETIVPAGPFRIRDLTNAVSGKIQVRVLEDDGREQSFEIDTASVPYLTRPGQLQFKTAVGQPMSLSHKPYGPAFTTGEASYGVTNSFSLYGGGIYSAGYQTGALGVAHDLHHFGAISADLTQAKAQLRSGTLQGKAWRASFSKRFEESASEFTFAGYRYSQDSFMTFDQFLSERYMDIRQGKNRQLYTITGSKSFRDHGITIFANWSHQTYWDVPSTNRYSVSMSQFLDIGRIKNVSLNLSMSRANYYGENDNTIYVGVSIPFGAGSAGFNSTRSSNLNTQNMNYSQNIDDFSSYRVSAGLQRDSLNNRAVQGSGYYLRNGELADLVLSGNWVEGDYNALGMSLSGGLTATAGGIALHNGGANGSTRMMVSTEGVEGVPFENNTRTNSMGVGVVTGLPIYHRYSLGVDVGRLPDDMEVVSSHINEFVLTQGAIGLRYYEVSKGEKLSAFVSLPDGRKPPFGASIRNSKGRERGIVAEQGQVWLTGVSTGEKLGIFWGDELRCTIIIPVYKSEENILMCEKDPQEAFGAQ